MLIDVTRLFYGRLIGRTPTGIDRVSLAYVRNYAPKARAVLSLGPFSSVLPDRASRRAFQLVLDPSRRSITAIAGLIALAFVWGWLPRRARGQMLVNTAHYGIEHAGYARLLRLIGVRPIFMIHDLIPITHPEFCRKGERKRHLMRIRQAVTVGNGIIANSKHTLDVLSEYCAAAKLDLPSATIAPLAPALTISHDWPVVKHGSYFVVLGTIEPRKNHLMLLHAWIDLIGRMGTNVPKLLIVGRRGSESGQVISMLESRVELRDHVIELARCADAEVVALLRTSRALLFPSFTEGYGLPVVEALSLGVPVIVSDLPAFREISHDAPEFVNPTDTSRWVDLIEDYSRGDSTRRRDQLARLERYAAPTWQQHFQIVNRFLEQLEPNAI